MRRKPRRIVLDANVVHVRRPTTDIQALLKVCDVYGVPVVTNVAGARILLSYLGILLTSWDPIEEPVAS